MDQVILAFLMVFSVMFAILFFCWHVVFLLHYFGWRTYDKEFRTEYRFREGTRPETPFYLQPPPWAEKLIRWIETKVGDK